MDLYANFHESHHDVHFAIGGAFGLATAAYVEIQYPDEPAWKRVALGATPGIFAGLFKEYVDTAVSGTAWHRDNYQDFAWTAAGSLLGSVAVVGGRASFCPRHDGLAALAVWKF
jgi:hypothetical protein